ncbi:hypothetical protein ABTZ03_42665 [Kitasatospora sp. NPDC096077]
MQQIQAQAQLLQQQLTQAAAALREGEEPADAASQEIHLKAPDA